MHAAVPRALRMADFNTPASTLTGVMAPDMTASGELHLCEDCFFKTIAYLKQECRTENLFSDKGPDAPYDFGLVARDDFFGDEGNR